jgi:hypothetical protein
MRPNRKLPGALLALAPDSQALAGKVPLQDPQGVPQAQILQQVLPASIPKQALVLRPQALRLFFFGVPAVVQGRLRHVHQCDLR